jgi:putative salt-induced outer membrane protein YdiY
MKRGIASLVLVMLGMASTAHAQATTSAQTPAASDANRFTGSATVGISLESGRTDLNGIQTLLEGQRPYSQGSTLTTYLSYAYATTGAPGEPARQTVANRLEGAVDLSQNFRKHLVMMLRVQALRDPVAQIRYRIGEMAGFGVRVGEKRVRFRLVPGVAFLNDDRHIAGEKGFHVHYGVYEELTATVSPEWTFTQYVSASRDVAHGHNQIVAVVARLAGAITKRVGIQFSYQYDYESIQPLGVEPDNQKTTVGLQFKF